MPEASIDQFAVAHGLEKAGFNTRQAEAMVRAMNIISGSNEQIASDVAHLRTDVSDLKRHGAQLNQRVGRLEQDVSHLKKDVAHLKQDLSHLKKDAKGFVTREELERQFGRLYIRMYVSLGAVFAFTVGSILTFLQFMLP